MAKTEKVGSSIEDESLFIEAIRNGEANAFQKLYNSYFPAFLSYILGQSGNEQDAKDIFQEALYTAWVKVRTDKYVHNGQSKFSTFVFEIAKRKWWNLARSNYMQKVDHTDNIRVLDQNVEKQFEPDVKEEQINMLNQMIGSLDKNCQEILKQFYFSKMSYDEMSTLLGKTPQTLKNQKFRCIGRLRELYLSELKK